MTTKESTFLSFCGVAGTRYDVYRHERDYRTTHIFNPVKAEKGILDAADRHAKFSSVNSCPAENDWDLERDAADARSYPDEHSLTSRYTLCINHSPDRDCGLSMWSDWTACSKPCNMGAKSSHRRKLSEPVGNGSCFGLNKTRGCNYQPCDATCQLSPWSEWITCSRSCGAGGGDKGRVRSVVTGPQGEGACGALEESQVCNDINCPLDCHVEEWSAWSNCTKTCGADGLKSRQRGVQQQPANGGAACPPTAQAEPCNRLPCPVHCGVSEWEDWSTCPATCGGRARTTRIRTVTTSAAHNGDSCPTLSESRTCALNECPVDCELSPWGPWHPCSTSCGGGGTRVRVRTVAVEPAYGGQPCAEGGPLREAGACNANVTCPPPAPPPLPIPPPVPPNPDTGSSYLPENATLAPNVTLPPNTYLPGGAVSADGDCQLHGGVVMMPSQKDVNTTGYETPSGSQASKFDLNSFVPHEYAFGSIFPDGAHLPPGTSLPFRFVAQRGLSVPNGFPIPPHEKMKEEESPSKQLEEEERTIVGHNTPVGAGEASSSGNGTNEEEEKGADSGLTFVAGPICVLNGTILPGGAVLHGAGSGAASLLPGFPEVPGVKARPQPGHYVGGGGEAGGPSAGHGDGGGSKPRAGHSQSGDEGKKGASQDGEVRHAEAEYAAEGAAAEAAHTGEKDAAHKGEKDAAHKGEKDAAHKGEKDAAHTGEKGHKGGKGAEKHKGEDQHPAASGSKVAASPEAVVAAMELRVASSSRASMKPLRKLPASLKFEGLIYPIHTQALKPVSLPAHSILPGGMTCSGHVRLPGGAVLPPQSPGPPPDGIEAPPTAPPAAAGATTAVGGGEVVGGNPVPPNSGGGKEEVGESQEQATLPGDSSDTSSTTTTSDQDNGAVVGAVIGASAGILALAAIGGGGYAIYKSRRRGGGEDGDEEEGLADETDALMEDQNTAFDEEEEKDAETFVEIERDASFWAGEDDVEDDQYAVREGYGEGFEEE
eukprot:GHVU01218140.1.p1 GENE.GHVU01218140.1~~GHVU01218140.1.p1  ORF type:complete len:1077 (+),score=264.82 GHVU01218140.1:252-3233(+)